MSDAFSKVTDATDNSAPVNATVFGQTIPILFGAAQVLGAPLWAAPAVTNDDGSRVITWAAMLGQRDPSTTGCVLKNVWIDSNLVFDGSGAGGVFEYEFYTGAEDQEASPAIVAIEGALKTPAFRDRIYIVVKNWKVPAGSNFPELTAEIVQSYSVDTTCYVEPFTRTNGSSHIFGTNYMFVDFATSLMWLACADSRYQVFDIDAQIQVGEFTDTEIARAQGSARYSQYLFCIGADNNKLCAVDKFGNKHFSDYSFSYHSLYCAAASHPLSDGLQRVFTQSYGPLFAITTLDPNTGELVNVRHVDKTYGYRGDAPICVLPQHRLTPNNDLAMCFFATGVQIVACLQPTSANAVMGVRQYHNENGNTINNNLTVSQSFLDVVFNLKEYLTATLGEPFNNATPWEIAAMAVDPINGAWLGVILYTGADDNFNYLDHTYYFRFKTAYAYLGQQTGTGPAPDLPSPWTLELETCVKLPFQHLSVGRGDFRAQNMADTETHMFLNNVAGSQAMCIFNFANGTYKVYPNNHYVLKDGGGAAGTGANNLDDWTTWSTSRGGFFYANIDGLNAISPGFALIGEQVSQGGTFELGTFFHSCALLAHYMPDQISVENIGDVIAGAVLNEQVSFLDLITVVTQLFDVDVVQSEGKVKFKRLHYGVDFTVDRVINESELAPINQGDLDDGHLLDKIRDTSGNLPGVLQVTYLDSENQYQLGTQTAKRTVFPARTSNSFTTQSFGVPVAMPTALALFLTDNYLFQQWARALSVGFRTTQKHLDLEPGDVIQINTDIDGNYILKLAEVALNGDMSLSMVGTNILSYPPSVNNKNNLNVASDDTGALPIVTQNGIFDFFVVDNINPNSGLGGETEADLFLFSSARLVFSLQNLDGTYALGLGLGTLVYGINNTELPAPQSWAIGRPNRDVSIDVTMKHGSPPVDGNGGYSRMLVGTIGRWEMIYYKGATRQGTTKTYTLDTIVRGMNGSDTVDGRHVADAILFIDASTLTPVAYTDFTGRSAPIYAAYPKQAPTAASSKQQHVSLVGGSLKPWAPVHVRAKRTSDGVVLRWLRRDRMTDYDGFNNTNNVPMSEITENYDLDIIAVNGSVVRTVVALIDATYTYTNEQIAVDSLDVSSNIHVKVYQNSAVVGRGYGRDMVCQVS